MLKEAVEKATRLLKRGRHIALPQRHEKQDVPELNEIENEVSYQTEMTNKSILEDGEGRNLEQGEKVELPQESVTEYRDTLATLETAVRKSRILKLDRMLQAETILPSISVEENEDSSSTLEKLDGISSKIEAVSTQIKKRQAVAEQLKKDTRQILSELSEVTAKL